MFKNILTTTPLTTDGANSFFSNIGGNSYSGDMTFVSTLRALLYSRIPSSENLKVQFSATNYTEQTLKNNSVDAVLDSITARGNTPPVNDDNSGIIQIHGFNGNMSADNIACMNLIEHQFCKRYSGWTRVEKVTDFFRKTFLVLCYIKPETKCVYLFVDNLTVQRMHYLQCAIFAFLPWYFDPEQGVTEQEMELINSLREKKSEKYEACLAEFASKFDFRTGKIRNLLAGFETRYERIQCEEIRDEIERIIERLESYNQEIGNYLRMKAEKEVLLLGLETKIQQGEGSGDSEIMDYFLCNNNLILEEVTDRVMTFSVKGYVDFFDEDMARGVIDNRRSYVYRPNGRACNNYIPEEDMKRLMYALFIDQTLRMKFCAAYQFELTGNVVALSHHNYGYECRDCTPNPHTDRYSCMGNYQRVINELLEKHDYITAIEQCSASCRSLNFGDGIVMQEFMNRLYGTNNGDTVNTQCIELPDGRVVRPKEAIAWLKEQEANTNE